jgi:DnaK suppressor protein
MKIDPSSELTAEQISALKEKLVQARREVVGRGRRPVQGHDPLEQNDPLGDSIDQAEATYEQSVSSEQSNSDSQRLHDIDDALARIEAGTYGVCEGTGEPIGFARLKVTPWARYTREYQEELEAASGAGHPPTL